MERAQRGQFLFGPLGGKQGDSMARQKAAGLRQRHTGLPTPLQQAAAALRLEVATPLGNGGLAQVRHLGSRRKAAMPGRQRQTGAAGEDAAT
jgi:hypothetical protein